MADNYESIIQKFYLAATFKKIYIHTCITIRLVLLGDVPAVIETTGEKAQVLATTDVMFGRIWNNDVQRDVFTTAHNRLC